MKAMIDIVETFWVGGTLGVPCMLRRDEAEKLKLYL